MTESPWARLRAEYVDAREGLGDEDRVEFERDLSELLRSAKEEGSPGGSGTSSARSSQRSQRPTAPLVDAAKDLNSSPVCPTPIKPRSPTMPEEVCCHRPPF